MVGGPAAAELHFSSRRALPFSEQFDFRGLGVFSASHIIACQLGKMCYHFNPDPLESRFTGRRRSSKPNPNPTSEFYQAALVLGRSPGKIPEFRPTSKGRNVVLLEALKNAI
jgi:hypothetical protein